MVLACHLLLVKTFFNFYGFDCTRGRLCSKRIEKKKYLAIKGEKIKME
jgi:hypothetical protein